MYRKRIENAEWDPPSPSTVYVKIKNIPYETFKTRLNEGLVSTELYQIRYRLERHIYCCKVCSKFVNEHCILTNKKTQTGRICKSFVPREEYIYLDSSPGLENPEKFKHLSETGIEVEIQGERSENGFWGKEGTKSIENLKNPENPENLENLQIEALYKDGVTLYRQGRLRLSLKAFERILSRAPHHFPALFHRANALLKLKCYEEALETFERAREINSNNAALWTNIGSTLLQLERFKKAYSAFEKSIALNPVQKNAWEGKEVTFACISRCEEKLKEAEKALTEATENPEILFEKGKLLLKLDEPEQARKAFEKALKTKPENASAWQLRGKILLEAGAEKESLYSLERAIKLKPDFPEAWYEKGKVFSRLGNLKGAENAFKIAANLWENKGAKIKAEAALARIRKLNLPKN
jgi:tetratricopeptide (TPR) repeat protein